MLFYQFDVLRNSPFSARGAVREARVMIRVDADVETSTNEAVKYLRERGWEIVGVRRAQQADSSFEFISDEAALQLYHDAAETGIACAITSRTETEVHSTSRTELVEA